MNESNYGTSELADNELSKLTGGHPAVAVLGVIATVVGLGRALDQAGQWFLAGWNGPK